MSLSFSYLETTARPVPGLRERCFRMIFLVASIWTVLGAGINFFTTGTTSPFLQRLHFFGVACLIVAMAIYSVAIPLFFLLREKPATA